MSSGILKTAAIGDVVERSVGPADQFRSMPDPDDVEEVQETEVKRARKPEIGT